MSQWRSHVVRASAVDRWRPGGRSLPTSTQSVPLLADDGYPLNRDCTVTVDSRSEPKPKFAGEGNKIIGFVAPETAEGTLIRLDHDWLVLRDGTEDNWIPKGKVLIIRVTR